MPGTTCSTKLFLLIGRPKRRCRRHSLLVRLLHIKMAPKIWLPWPWMLSGTSWSSIRGPSLRRMELCGFLMEESSSSFFFLFLRSSSSLRSCSRAVTARLEIGFGLGFEWVGIVESYGVSLCTRKGARKKRVLAMA